MNLNFKQYISLVLSVFFLLPNASLASSTINISGAGPSTQIVVAFFSAFKDHNPKYANTTFTVPPRSIKHAGGIRWSNKNLFGRTGRSLKPSERAKNKQQILLAAIPAVFVKGKNIHVKEISPTQLEKIYRKGITNWKEIGGPDVEITLIGREPTEAIHTKLKSLYPFMNDIKYWLTFTRDHQIQGYITSKRGDHSLAFGAKPNFDESSIIKISGPQTGVSVGLVYDLKNEKDSMLLDVKTFAQSTAWKNIVKKQGYLTIEQ